MTAGTSLLGASALTTLLALVAVLALVLISAKLLRATRRGQSRRLALSDSLALDARRRLHLVRCDGREVLLLTGGSADVVVGWLPEAPPQFQLPGEMP